MFAIKLVPSYTISLTVGNRWIIHTDGRGSPYCFSCQADLKDKRYVIAKTNKYPMTVRQLLDLLSVCLDKKSFVFFELNGADADNGFSFGELLQLDAGDSLYELMDY